MNAGTLTVIDEYVEALLGSAPPAELSVITGPAASAALAAAPVAMDAGLDLDHATNAPTPSASAPAVVPTMSAAPAAPLPSSAMPPEQARPFASLPASHRWLRVIVGGDSYALELLRVQEVVRLAPVVAMRGARRAVLGVMNLRGRIVPVFDLGLWLGSACVQPEERSRIVVVERDDELIGVLVTAVEDVVTLGRERIEPPLAGGDRGAIVGIARVGNGAPTVLLDAQVLFG